MLKYAAVAYGMPKDLQMKLEQIAFGYPIVLAVVIVISGIVDALKIAFAGQQRSDGDDTN